MVLKNKQNEKKKALRRVEISAHHISCPDHVFYETFYSCGWFKQTLHRSGERLLDFSPILHLLDKYIYKKT